MYHKIKELYIYTNKDNLSPNKTYYLEIGNMKRKEKNKMERRKRLYMPGLPEI